MRRRVRSALIDEYRMYGTSSTQTKPSSVVQWRMHRPRRGSRARVDQEPLRPLARRCRARKNLSAHRAARRRNKRASGEEAALIPDPSRTRPPRPSRPQGRMAGASTRRINERSGHMGRQCSRHGEIFTPPCEINTALRRRVPGGPPSGQALGLDKDEPYLGVFVPDPALDPIDGPGHLLGAQGGGEFQVHVEDQ